MEYDFNNENFDKLMEEFVKLDILEKREQIIKDLQYIIVTSKKLCEINNSSFEMLYNKEISDLDKPPVSEKDFLEAVYAYLYIVKSSNYQFVNSVIKGLVDSYNNQNNT